MKSLAEVGALPAALRKTIILRRKLQRIAAALAIGSVAPLHLHAEEHDVRKPNVVVVFIDDLG